MSFTKAILVWVPTKLCAASLIVSLVLVINGMNQLRAADEPNVFRRPALAEASQQLTLRAILLARSGQLAAALPLCEQAAQIAPFSAAANYNLACIQAKNDQLDKSLVTLKRAIELGFHNAAHISEDPDLISLLGSPELSALVDEAKKPFKPLLPQANRIEDGVGWVGPENTVWDESTNLLRTAFEWNRPDPMPPIIKDHGELGDLLRMWYAEGTAAGHFGDLYDNCDRDHSNLNYADFPQLNRIEYRPEIANDVPQGLQNRILHGGVVLGNSSTAMVNSPIWRSNPRLAYVNQPSMITLTRQYFQNHLYIYPEHEDHDNGHNGNGGYGDVYTANMPYVLISQGSSYTDQPFLDALACTLAAFRPEVKQRLVERGLIAPTLQQIFRSSYKLVQRPEDYLTGIAHPSVFEGSQIDAKKMVEAAHSLTLETIPPVIRIRVEQQDLSIPGRDYFDAAEGENLFDTPCAVARIGRSVQYHRKMIVSARDSFDVNQRALEFKWVILRGDESLISIKPTDETGSRAEITVAWHPRRKIHPEGPMESNRVDIGVFANNGANWSAPAFVTWFFLDNEDREYDDQGRIRSVTYHGGSDAGNYVDPFINVPKSWKDTYRYSNDGRLIGWTRTRGSEPEQQTEEITANGGLIIEKDDLGRAVTARALRYVPEKRNDKPLPILVQNAIGEIWHYQYANPEDQIGKVVSQEKSPP